MADVTIPLVVLTAIGAGISIVGAGLSAAVGALWVKLKDTERREREWIQTALGHKDRGKADARLIRHLRRDLELAERGAPSVAPPPAEEDEEPTGVYDSIRNEDTRWLQSRTRRAVPEKADPFPKLEDWDPQHPTGSTPPGAYDPPVAPRRRMPSRSGR